MNVVEMHATWLTINSIVGCTNGCKYCFLQREKNNTNKPKIRKSEKDSVEELLHSKYYNEKIPICLLPNTDAFLNESNISYLKNLLLELKKNNVTNTLTVVTKCYIPKEFIAFLKEHHFDKQIVIYLSYSGLGKSLEPNVNPLKIRENFINLSKNNIKIIHYFRPIIPINGTRKKINEILSFVNQYTKVSVITGLKIKPSFYELIEFWPEIKDYKEEALKAEGVWPKDAFDYIYNDFNLDHYLFQTNFCALKYVLNEPCSSYFNSYECKNYNLCPLHQRNLCKNYIKKLEYQKIEDELKKIGKYSNDLEIVKQEDGLLLKGVDLSVGDVSYLTEALNSKIFVQSKNKSDDYFNSSLVGAEPFIIGGRDYERLK